MTWRKSLRQLERSFVAETELDRDRRESLRRTAERRAAKRRAARTIRQGRSRFIVLSVTLVATGGVWIATRAGWLSASSWVVRSPFHTSSQWPHLLTAPFTYFYATGANLTGTGVYQFATLFAVAVFGWLLERRHGPIATASVFLLGAVGGTYVAVLAQNGPHANLHIAGANGGALALLCAWAVPDLLARRGRRDYDGDLLGTGVIALVLLAMPLARPEANPIAGGFGVLTGYLSGLALAHRRGN